MAPSNRRGGGAPAVSRSPTTDVAATRPQQDDSNLLKLPVEMRQLIYTHIKGIASPAIIVHPTGKKGECTFHIPNNLRQVCAGLRHDVDATYTNTRLPEEVTLVKTKVVNLDFRSLMAFLNGLTPQDHERLSFTIQMTFNRQFTNTRVGINAWLRSEAARKLVFEFMEDGREKIEYSILAAPSSIRRFHHRAFDAFIENATNDFMQNHQGLLDAEQPHWSAILDELKDFIDPTTEMEKYLTGKLPTDFKDRGWIRDLLGKDADKSPAELGAEEEALDNEDDVNSDSESSSAENEENEHDSSTKSNLDSDEDNESEDLEVGVDPLDRFRRQARYPFMGNAARCEERLRQERADEAAAPAPRRVRRNPALQAIAGLRHGDVVEDEDVLTAEDMLENESDESEESEVVEMSEDEEMMEDEPVMDQNDVDDDDVMEADVLIV